MIVNPPQAAVPSASRDAAADMPEPTSSPSACESIRMLIDAWALMIGRYPGHAIATRAGVATAFANRPLAFFNLSTLAQPFPEADAFRAALKQARATATSSPHPSFLALSGDWAPGDWEDLAADAGWLRAMLMTGMRAERLLPPRRGAPALEFRLVGDTATALDLGTVNALAYAMPPELFDCTGEMTLWRGASFGVVGYVEERPVTSAAAFLVGDVIYVAMVASAPGLHGRGYGEAAMRHAIGLAEEAVGPRRIWLHATAAGLPLYQAMGFAPGPELVMLHLAPGGSWA